MCAAPTVRPSNVRATPLVDPGVRELRLNRTSNPRATRRALSGPSDLRRAGHLAGPAGVMYGRSVAVRMPGGAWHTYGMAFTGRLAV